MGDGGVVDDADGLLAVDVLGVHLVAGALLLAGGVLAEVEEGLGRGLVDVIPRGAAAAVLLLDAVEELVVLAGDDAGVPAAEHVVIIAAVVGVDGVVGDQQRGGDQRGLGLVVQQDGGAAGQRAVGVAGDADAAGVHKGQRSHHLDGVIHAVGVVFRLPPGAVGQIFRVAVAVHVDGQHHKAAAGVFHIVQVLHLAVVVPAVAADDGGGGVLRRSGVGDQEQRAHLMAAGGLEPQVADGHLAEAGLHGAGADAADQAQHQRDAQPEPCLALLGGRRFHG